VDEAEPEPEAVSPDPQLSAEGGSGEASSVDGACKEFGRILRFIVGTWIV
jgi:hypothetical protein